MSFREGLNHTCRDCGIRYCNPLPKSWYNEIKWTLGRCDVCHHIKPITNITIFRNLPKLTEVLLWAEQNTPETLRASERLAEKEGRTLGRL